MSKKLSILLILAASLIVGLGYYLFIITKSSNTLTETQLDYEGVKTMASLDCKINPPFQDIQLERDYTLRLFDVFQEKTNYDSDTGILISPSNKKLALHKFEISASRVNANRQPTLFPTPGAPRPNCWIATIEDVSLSGRAAYETDSGEIKILKVKNLPSY